MHTPTRPPHEDDEERDVRPPPVPPDQELDVVPERDPPEPDHDREEPPMIARAETRNAWLRSVLALVLCSVAAATGAAESTPANTIRVIAEAHVKAPANLALLDFGVVTQAESAAAASRENAQRMEAVLAAARKSAGADARMSTGTYTIRPVYAAQREGGAPRITGYEVNNTLHLRTTELGRVSATIDAAVRAGANRMQRLAFTLADEDAAKREALRNAVLKAREKAQTVAGALGLTVGPVYSVLEEDSGVVRPLMREAFAAQIQGAPATPIEPGEVEVRARVTLTTEIAR